MEDNTFNEIMKLFEDPNKETQDEPEKPKVEINEERFQEEYGRVLNYLKKLSTRETTPSDVISILEDLDVITDTNGLSVDEIIKQLYSLYERK